MDEPEDEGVEYAEVVRLPVGRRPETRRMELEGDEVTVIYLPWPHEVDGQTRPAGLYVSGDAEAAGAGAVEDAFLPDHDERGLEETWRDAEQALRRHRRAEPDVSVADDPDDDGVSQDDR